MPIHVDQDILEHYCCLEPEVGEQLLFLYPEFLSDDQKQAFELHVQTCEACRERQKFWQAMGLAFRVEALLNRVTSLIVHQDYQGAFETYNQLLGIHPDIWKTLAGETCFQAGAWQSLTAARSKDRDFTPYLAPGYAPQTYQLAAASSFHIFPLTIKYAGGKITGKLSTVGRQVFFELVDASDEFQEGILLAGTILQPVIMLKSWSIVPGRKQRLGRLHEFFESVELPHVIDALRRFKVYPL